MITLLGISLVWYVLFEIALLFILVINECETAATASLFIFGLIVHFFTKLNVLQFFRENGTFILELAAIYIGAGLAWSVAKWYFFVRDKRAEYDAIVEEFKKGDKKDFKWQVERRVGEIPPRAVRHKREIVSWISYWPISVVWTLLDDFLKKLFHRIYDLFAGVFQRISNAQFKGVQVEHNNDT